MKKQFLTVIMMMGALNLMALAAPAMAQGGQWGNGPGEYIDENGDGFNDLAPDADNDGIPNKFDDDYEKPQDGSGAGYGANKGSENGPSDGTGYKHQSRNASRRANWGTKAGEGKGICTNPEDANYKANKAYKSQR